jgi:hypothetical protein
MRPYLKRTHRKKKKKRADGVAQGLGHEFKPQYHKKQKQQQNLNGAGFTDA